VTGGKLVEEGKKEQERGHETFRRKGNRGVVVKKRKSGE